MTVAVQPETKDRKKNAAGLKGKRNLRITFFGTVLNDFNRKAKSQGKSNALPDRTFFEKCNEHHYKAEDADHDRKSIFFGEIFFHDLLVRWWILHEVTVRANIGRIKFSAFWFSAKPQKTSAKSEGLKFIF
ncbi:hypothetical protein [Flavisolibacter ginsenosidimutans]|uniref:Uncharacterized protein n=1 Tax=Flavisolibacter ginsenosidimutans TaxID=661481 RepID=A0A5B8UDY3_9BACT|nr:hypothetical protein [Flavisolibacter ginsenosidimutans]QEC54516.1 hypothetical protein FSB75_00905 [Flavisolibacter ginsenosidimutans]